MRESVPSTNANGRGERGASLLRRASERSETRRCASMDRTRYLDCHLGCDVCVSCRGRERFDRSERMRLESQDGSNRFQKENVRRERDGARIRIGRYVADGSGGHASALVRSSSISVRFTARRTDVHVLFVPNASPFLSSSFASFSTPCRRGYAFRIAKNGGNVSLKAFPDIGTKIHSRLTVRSHEGTKWRIVGSCFVLQEDGHRKAA